jgi:plastocyanin
VRPSPYLAGNANHRRPKLALAAVGLLAVAPLLATACGGGETGSAGTVPANPNLRVIAEDIKFDQETYSVPAGEVRIAYDSNGQQVHSMVFQDATGENIPDFRLQVAPGKEVGGTLNLAAGSYTMICDIPGHEAAGMVATVTVS